MSGSTLVRLLRAVDGRTNRATVLLWREDQPEQAVPFHEEAEPDVQCMIDNAERRANLCQWYFSSVPLSTFHTFELVTEYQLHLRRAA